jgi:flavin reductase (DIM6/NTAB) family NADH-FMN oxidoreductase RutF
MHPNFKEHLVETTRKMEDPGLLLVSANRQGKNDVMTIGWGLIGVFWGKPVFLVAVRPSRYTHEFIEDSGEFTVNVPEEGMDDAVQLCGEVSGREHDKFSECKLDLLRSRTVRTPIIRQCELHYECRVIHKLDVTPKLVPTEVKKAFYPRDDHHTLYFGEILAIY